MCQDKWRFGSFKILTNSKGGGVNTENRKLIICLLRAKIPLDDYDNDGDDLWRWDLNPSTSCLLHKRSIPDTLVGSLLSG